MTVIGCVELKEGSADENMGVGGGFAGGIGGDGDEGVDDFIIVSRYLLHVICFTCEYL